VFSGIVKGVGRVLEQADAGGDRRLVIGWAGVAMEQPAVGASVAVNGVCLTATSSLPDRFAVDVSSETLAVTTIASFEVGRSVNLEPSLRLGDPLDGHLVAGHVDGVGEVVELRRSARSVALTFELPVELSRYVARKGSIAVDGVSLTVNAVEGARFEVNVVPHTLHMTIIPGYRPGTAVNIEIDVLARYVERLATTGLAQPRIDRDFLESHGYTSKD
jgi:riboflavin synthase